MLIKDIIIESARKYPNKTAVVLEDTRYTFGELNNRANSLANALSDMGIAKGDRVAILLDNCLPYVDICCALVKGGMVVIPINPSLSKQDLAYIINDAEANTLFLGENYIDLFNSIREEIRGVKNLITVGATYGEMRNYEELVSKYPPEEPEVEIDEQDRVVVRTDHAVDFYRQLPGWLLANGLQVEELQTLDDSLQAVFDYLVGD